MPSLDQIIIDEDIKRRDAAYDNSKNFFAQTFGFDDVKEGEVIFWHKPQYALHVGLPEESCWGIDVNEGVFKKVFDPANGIYSIIEKIVIIPTRKSKKYSSSEMHELAHKAYYFRLEPIVKTILEKYPMDLRNMSETATAIVDGFSACFLFNTGLCYKLYLIDELLNHDRNAFFDLISDFNSKKDAEVYLKTKKPSLNQKIKARFRGML